MKKKKKQRATLRKLTLLNFFKKNRFRLFCSMLKYIHRSYWIYSQIDDLRAIIEKIIISLV